MEENKVKHLEMIQMIITRMNSNSFQIKGWMITIVSALLAIYASSRNVTFIFIAIFPSLLFWYLDAYYLQQERKFRELYKDVLRDDSTIPYFAMPIQNYTNNRCCILSTFFSRTIGWLYGIIVILLAATGLFLKYGIVL